MSKQAEDESASAKQAARDFIDWRDFDPSWLPGGEQAPLAAELVTYRDHLDELLKHKGQLVVIKGQSGGPRRGACQVRDRPGPGQADC